ncbi:Leucine-rich repeat protein [Seminavis robusta]|uniref:Leucine-rich repeat protein n=1 Tax=Seminavis robusta TaxID=568900 RepID=A0A9N8DEK4_9STRA|nr:Leucine-rich repeat protein [Seminavis robusta]|eukprot:Sro119_g058210.1 Leucine-rich repeat protein (476) ;mRNA; r:89151-90578
MTANQSTAPRVLTIYHAIICNAMRIGYAGRLATGADFDEIDYLPMQEICWSAYCDVFPNNSFIAISDANLKQAIKHMLLRSHPDKVAKHGDDYRVHYASLAVTSLLNHVSAWIKTTNTNASSVNTGVDVLEMPPLLLTSFGPAKSKCSLPSAFEALASIQFASASKPSSEVHRLNLERTKDLAKKAQYAEAIFWEKANLVSTTLCQTHLTYISKPDTSYIPDTSNTGSVFAGSTSLAEDQKVIQEVIGRLKTNDKALSHIHLENQDLASSDNLSKMVDAMKHSHCHVKSIYIDSILVTTSGLSQLFQFLATENKTVTSFTLKGVVGWDVYRYISKVADMIRNNKTMTELTLVNCNFPSAYNADGIAEALQHNSTLKKVDFRRCGELYSEGASDLANGLVVPTSNSALELLSLYRTGLTNKTAPSLVNLIVNHPTLKCLDLRENHFSETVLDKLRDAMSKSGCLKELLVDPPTLKA